MQLKREPRRVAYILSTPEWFGHNVNDMFFRDEAWLFVPLQDLSLEDQEREYQKATYFFISGYGHPEIAQRAAAAGWI